MVKWYNFFTFDIIGTLTFGEPFGCLADGGYHPWVAAIVESVKLGSFLRSVAYYPLLSKFSRHLVPPTLKQRRKDHHAMTKAKVRARQEYKTERADFMSGFMEPNADVSDAEILATAQTVIVAGSETTATLLSGITYLLIQHPRVLEKVRCLEHISKALAWTACAISDPASSTMLTTDCKSSSRIPSCLGIVAVNLGFSLFSIN